MADFSNIDTSNIGLATTPCRSVATSTPITSDSPTALNQTYDVGLNNPTTSNDVPGEHVSVPHSKLTTQLMNETVTLPGKLPVSLIPENAEGSNISSQSQPTKQVTSSHEDETSIGMDA